MSQSYTTYHANAARNGRVMTRAPELTSLSRVDPFADVGHGAKDEPSFVFVSPRSDFVVVDFGRVFEVHNGTDGKKQWADRKPRLPALALIQDEILLNGYGRKWAGGREEPRVTVFGGKTSTAWAFHADAKGFVQIVENPATGNHDQVVGAGMTIAAHRFIPDPNEPSETIVDRLYYEPHLPGEGAGAIDGDGRIALAFRDGAFIVYERMALPDTRDAKVAVREALGVSPYDLSATDDGFALLVANDPAPVTDKQALWMRHHMPRASNLTWSSEVRLLGRDGKLRWKATVGFEVLQPPIAGKGDRLVLAGKGFAAVEAGRVVWSHSSAAPVFATAFEDGSLAVAVGASLRIVAPDGTIRQSLDAAPGERFTTPPAIASDGSVWIATNQALYHAR